MYRFTVDVKTSVSGGYIRVPIEARNIGEATQHAKALYGKELLRGPYSPVKI